MIHTTSKPIELKRFTVADGFWKQEMELVRKEVLPYQWEILNDRIPEAAPSYCMRNFKLAGKLMREKLEKGPDFVEPVYSYRGFEVLPEDREHPEDQFYGFVFQDSDFSKWIEAVAYSLMNHQDAELERIADEAIDVVCAAQHESGYLDTYYILTGMDQIFTNLRDHHELYCFGHLVEGAVAYYNATGKDKLLQATIRFADYILEHFGAEEGKCKGYPGHEIAEMALVRLYEVTGEERYLQLSRFFLEQRGTQPYYFQEEHPQDKIDHFYHQSHLPVREQDEAVGHAVRAVYLYSGMADVARLTGDEKLWEACKKIWHSITREKMYITGGIGGTHIGEAFSYAYDLPNDTAYAETCASIGLMFFARRMLAIEADSKYADVMEQALYNTVLSGMALDGKSFFYVNPLEVYPKACHEDERKAHVKPVRQKWFGCACCPPNLARLISSIPAYAYGESADTLYMHLYIGGELRKSVGDVEAKFQVESAFPWQGDVHVTYTGEKAVEMKLALRIPGWCKDFTLSGAHGKEVYEEQGYLYVEGLWQPSDCLELSLPMEIRMMQADARVRENAGKIAIMRGPLVYCMEEADNGEELHRLLLCASDCHGHQDSIIEKEVVIGGQSFPAIVLPGKREINETSDDLYQEYVPIRHEDVELTFVPYYAWANRGENEMAVWVRNAYLEDVPRK